MSAKCVMCSWYIQDSFDGELKCSNPESEYFGNRTDYYDSCEDFEEEEESEYEK